MIRMNRSRWALGMGIGLILGGLTGCQTWVPDVGMTLPSGRYLQHRVQYIPKSPAFPLSRELASMEAQGGPVPGGPGGPLPQPVAP